MPRVVSISIWVWTIVPLDMKWESILILVDLWVLRMVGVGTYQHSLLDGPLLWRWLVTVGWLGIRWLNIAGSEGGAGSGGVTFLLGLSSLQILAFIQIIADLKICKSYCLRLSALSFVGIDFVWLPLMWRQKQCTYSTVLPKWENFIKMRVGESLPSFDIEKSL